MTQPVSVPFTLAQLTAAVQWGALGRHGLGVRVAVDHEAFPELLEVYRAGDPWLVVWSIYRTRTGAIVVESANGVGWAGRGVVLDTLGAALDAIEAASAMV